MCAVSIAVDATRWGGSGGGFTVIRHTLFSRALLLAALILAGYANYEVPLANRLAWKWGFAVPWLLWFGVGCAGIDFAKVRASSGFLAISMGVWWLIIWAATRSWRRAWRKVEGMVRSTQQ